jgi:hypothetical protein
MAAVKETIGHYVQLKGGPIYETETHYYIYCDKCGSFKIRPHLRLIHWVGLVFCIYFTAFVTNKFVFSKFPNHNIVGWMMYGVFIVVCLEKLSKYIPHQCMKCRNTKISYRDVLKYSAYQDLTLILDIPKTKLHKHDELRTNIFSDLKLVVITLVAIVFMVYQPLILIVWIMYFIVNIFIEKFKS